uniref:C2H2-type domain-containing protein n=1 Tax=Anopheles farauti TaxID=69004 RepID=A0A182QLF2_9DIPT
MDYNNAYNKPYCGVSQPVPGPSSGFFPPNGTTPTFLKVPNPPYIKQEVVADAAIHRGTVTPPVNYSQNQNYGVEMGESTDPDKPLFYRNIPYMTNPNTVPSVANSITVTPITAAPSLALNCDTCMKHFETKEKLDQHAKTHQTLAAEAIIQQVPIVAPSQNFSCDTCPKTFETKVKLDKHAKTHQPPADIVQKEFKCRMCDKTFRTKSTLICHEKVHGENGLDNSFSCVECGKVFASADKLHVHRRLHTGEKPYQCKVCLKRFNHQSNLIVHSRIHQKVKQALKCARCNKVLDSEERLAIHMRLHTGEKPYKCSYCDKRFNHKSTVSTHEKAAHIAANSFKCDRCHKTFNQKCQLQYHEKLQEEHTIACTICDKVFCYKASHKEHMFKVHFPRQKKGGSVGETSTRRAASDGQGRNKFKCTICDRRFYYKRALEMHMGVHDARLDVNVLYFSCNYCPETFTEETELEKHETKHVSDGTTDFLENMKVLEQSADDKFRCPLCFKGFNDQQALRDHHKTHLCTDSSCSKCVPAQSDEFDLKRSTYDASEDTRPTACNICHRVLPSFEQFQNHFHYHTTRVPFYCYHCREEFSGKRELYAHSRTHSTREPESYTCEVCAKVFSTKGNYKRHLKSHETVRAFACDRCSKQYDYKSALEVHLKRAHGIEL